MPDQIDLAASLAAAVEEESNLDCEGCGTSLPSDDLNDEGYCHECLYACPICDGRHPDQDAADTCCQTRCSECRSLHEYESDAEECCQTRCPECGELHRYEEDAASCCRRQRGGDSYYPTLPAIPVYDLTVKALDGRAPRYISIEQELTDGGAAVAQMLYDHGLSEQDEVCDYTYQPSIRGIAVCEDGSLPDEGGEVKYSRFDLSRRTDAAKLSLAVSKIRQLHKDAGVVSVGTSAGMHIHGGAKDRDGRVLEPVPMAALHELFTFGEDMIYGLAAAGWQRHRYSGTGNDYAKPIPRIEGKKSPWKVSRVMGSKYYGINFERLLGTVRHCGCGSVRFGAWSECECGAFDGATVEWRVFNTSTKPETIHAWVLFVSAVMELAMHHTPGTLDDNPFNPRLTDTPSRKARRMDVLGWFLNNCRFTDDERDVIRAAADRSPLMSPTSSRED